MVIKNDAQLRSALMKKCADAVSSAEIKVYGEFFDNVHNFYTEFEPDEYIRTYALYNSLDSSGVNMNGDSVNAKVYFNTPSYEQGMMELQHTPEHGMYGWASLSGEEVLDNALKSGRPHGGRISGTPIWTTSMKSLGGKSGIRSLIIQELKKQGL
jgi:hypothetical protein